MKKTNPHIHVSLRTTWAILSFLSLFFFAPPTKGLAQSVPKFTSTPVTEVNEGAAYRYEISLANANVAQLDLGASTLPDWLSLKEETNVSTFAGSGVEGFRNGAGPTAQFDGPTGVAVDATGNVYVADWGNYQVRKISKNPDGTINVSTFAGTGNHGFRNGAGTVARFNIPYGVAVDAAGNAYVSDQNSPRIRKVIQNPDGTVNVSTLAGTGDRGFRDGPGTVAQFNYPAGMAVDAAGNVYVADQHNHRVRKIIQNPDGTVSVSTFAGTGVSGFRNGAGTVAQFKNPVGVALDAAGNVYVADQDNHRVRKIIQNPDGTVNVSTFAGSGDKGFQDGAGAVVKFNAPNGVAVDAAGNVYVMDKYNYRVRKIIQNPDGTVNVSTFAGSGKYGFQNGAGAVAKFRYSTSVALDATGNVYVADRVNNRIRKVALQEVVLSGTAGVPGDYPVTLKLKDGKGGYVDQTFTIKVKDVTAPQAVSYAPSPGGSGISIPNKLTITFGEAVQTGTGSVSIIRSSDGVIAETVQMSGISVNGKTATINLTANLKKGEVYYVLVTADAFEDLSGNSFSGISDKTAWTFETRQAPKFTSVPVTEVNEKVAYSYEIGLANASAGQLDLAASTLPDWLSLKEETNVSTLAGTGNSGFQDGDGATAKFSSPFGVAIDSKGNVYVADYVNNRIRKIIQNPDGTASVSTLAGGSKGFRDGDGATAKFDRPTGVAVDAGGNIYVVDNINNRIRKIVQNSDGTVNVSTLAGTGEYGFRDGDGSTAKFRNPFGVVVDGSGNVYVADYDNHRIRKISKGSGGTINVSTLAGSGGAGFLDGDGAMAKFYFPYGVAVDAEGNVYVADFDNSRIRKIVQNPGGTVSVSTLAGIGTPGFQDGSGGTAKFKSPTGVAVDASGNVYVADRTNHRIRKITQNSDGTASVSTLAGTGALDFQDGDGATAKFSFPTGVAVDASGNVYVADRGNNRVRKVAQEAVLSGTTSVPGDYPVTLKLKDGEGGYIDQTFTIKVKDVTAPQAVSYAPSPGSLDISVPNKLTVTFDEDIRKGTGSVSVIRSSDGVIAETIQAGGISINGKTATLSLATKLKKGEAYHVLVTADAFEDLSGNSFAGISDKTVWSFETRQAPKFTSVPVTEVNEKVAYSYEIGLANASVAQLDLVASTLPDWLILQEKANVSTLAGTGDKGFQDGAGSTAKFNSLIGVSIDASGDVYVADYDNHRIRKISHNPDGTVSVSTLAGGSKGFRDGDGSTAKFNFPTGVAIGADGNVYVAEQGNNRIRKITQNSNGTVSVSTLAGGNKGFRDGDGSTAKFNSPIGVAIDDEGNVYVADQGNNRIRKITQNGDGTVSVSTLSGTGVGGFQDGAGSTAEFSSPTGVAIGVEGNVYVADQGNNRIRKVTQDGAGTISVSTLAGTGVGGFQDGAGSTAEFSSPTGVTIDAEDNVYIADAGNLRIRKIRQNPNGTASVSTLAGTGDVSFQNGEGSVAKFRNPFGLTVNTEGDVYVVDYYDHRVRKITQEAVLSGTPNMPGDYSVVLKLKDGEEGYIDQTFTIKVKDVTAPQAVSYVPSQGGSGISIPNKLTITFDEDIRAGTGSVSIIRNSDDVIAETIQAGGFSVNGKMATINLTANLKKGEVYHVLVTAGAFEDLSGNPFTGILDKAVWTFETRKPPKFTSVPATEVNAGTTYRYEARIAYADISQLDISASTLPDWLSLKGETNVSTLAGTGVKDFQDGDGTTAKFKHPADVAIDAEGNVYVADRSNHRIRKIIQNSDGTASVSTLAGTGDKGFQDGAGSTAQFNYPTSLAVDAKGNIYVGDQFNHRVRKIIQNSDGTTSVSTLAGTGNKGFLNGEGTTAKFNEVGGIAVDASGTVYVADQGNHRIRKITQNPDGTASVSTLAGRNKGFRDGDGTTAKFDIPYGVAVDAEGNVFVVDRSNHRIRKITQNPDGTASVSTLAGAVDGGFQDGEGLTARFNFPRGGALDAEGNVYVGDRTNHRIRKIIQNLDGTVTVSTLAGAGKGGFQDGDGATAQFDAPYGVELDAENNVYVADFWNQRIRKITQQAVLSGTTSVLGDYPVTLKLKDGEGGYIDQTFTIKVKDATGPQAVSYTPSPGVSGISIPDKLTIAFNEDIQTGTGSVSVIRNSDGVIAETIQASGVFVNGTTATINLATNLEKGEPYHVLVTADAFEDLSGNSFAGISDKTVWTFETVQKAVPTINFSDIQKTYGDTDFNLSATSNSEGALQYSIVGDGKGASLSGTGNKTISLGDAGTLTLKVKIAESDDHLSGEKTAVLKVNKKALTVTPEAGQSKVYGQTDPELKYTALGLVNGDALTGSLRRESGENAGSYAINAGDLSAGNNYTVSFGGAEFKIEKKALTVTPEAGQSKVYGEADPELKYTAVGLVNGDALTGSLAREVGENTGSYAIKAGDLSAGNNYTVSFGGAEFKIEKKALTVTPEAGQSKVYGEADPELKYTAVGLVSDDALTGSLARESGENAGSYAINAGDLSAGNNYTVSFGGAEFKIEKKALTVTPEAGQSKVYGETDPELKYTAVGLVEGDAFTGALAREGGEDVGSYAISAGDLSAGNNYATSFGTAEFKIDKKALTVTPEAGQSKVYGETDPELKYTALGLVSGDKMTGALAREAGEDVGSYAISAGDLSAGNNYATSIETAEFKIEKKALTVTPEAGQSKVYGQTDPELKYTAVGLVNGDALTGSLAREAGENAGSYAIKVGNLSAGNNYVTSIETAEFKIEKKALTVTPEAGQSKVYGEIDPELKYTTVGLVNGDALTGSLAREVGEDVGSYAIKVGNLSAGNNYATSIETAEFKIDKKALNVTPEAGQSKVYGEIDPNLKYTAVGLVSGDKITGALARELGENAGSYAIKAGDLSAGNNYTVSFGTAEFKIEKATLTLSADDKERSFGANNPELTFTASGFRFDDGMDLLNPTPNLSTDADKNSEPGEYTIELSETTAPNYMVVRELGTLTVTSEGYYPELDIPTMIIPNGNGMNDVWDIRNTEFYSWVRVSVFSQQGEMVYQEDQYGPDNPWDGDVDGGVYVFVIETSRGKVYKGQITVKK
ncbi:hypothetical protein FUAX_50470 (plasmid) [Fulvitalea axinellae]|uniref:NHL repeat-containing protein n=1 Tax=Fulvitalea axinellae TaxID=1182444 RepID=A0AAU9DJ90_9BACT|nr:hypothetical protein FUAX_50470 [Fulvitalea axinellae]